MFKNCYVVISVSDFFYDCIFGIKPRTFHSTDNYINICIYFIPVLYQVLKIVQIMHKCNFIVKV